MKDIPVFTTEHGVAGLVLREVAVRGDAYVRIHASEEPLALMEDCVGFCRAVGAERIYAAGHEALCAYPLHTAIVRMACLKSQLGETDAALFPVQRATAGRFQEIYNEKVRRVPNGAWMTDSEVKVMLEAGDGYFIHRGGTLLGIGRANAEEIRFLASCAPGAGADVVRALGSLSGEETVRLEVASANEKAMGLYEKLGFLPCRETARWYRVFPK